jgi:hypothetical protein
VDVVSGEQVTLRGIQGWASQPVDEYFALRVVVASKGRCGPDVMHPKGKDFK